MKIGGLRKLSLIDYPGEISTVVFTTGCNFRCNYCHNSHLVLPELFPDDIPEDEVINFLKTRIGKISAVVISGGEPTLHHDLPAFITKIKSLGFKIKLDSNGTNPSAIQELINSELVDYIAMDIKTSPENYNAVCGVKTDIKKIRQSIEVIKKSTINSQFRMTIVNGIHTVDDIRNAEDLLSGSSLIKQYFKLVPTVLDKTLTTDFH
jgi:pyruvate formate lyase activating enzyme